MLGKGGDNNKNYGENEEKYDAEKSMMIAGCRFCSMVQARRGLWR
jgi:hypothetical protein